MDLRRRCSERPSYRLRCAPRPCLVFGSHKPAHLAAHPVLCRGQRPHLGHQLGHLNRKLVYPLGESVECISQLREASIGVSRKPLNLAWQSQQVLGQHLPPDGVSCCRIRLQRCE